MMDNVQEEVVILTCSVVLMNIDSFSCDPVPFHVNDFYFIPLYSIVLIPGELCHFGLQTI
jgi:hypothetical protein